MTPWPLVTAFNLLATFVALIAIACNLIGMTLHINPDGPLGWLSKGLIMTAGAILIFGWSTPFWLDLTKVH